MMYCNGADDFLMDDFPTSPSPFLSDQTMPSILNADNLSIFDNLPDISNQSNAFTDNSPANQPDGIQGSDGDLWPLPDIDIADCLNSLLAYPNNNPAPDNQPPVEETSTKSFVVKSSNAINTTNFIDGYSAIRTGESIHLAIPPFEYQRARYEKELKKVLRYIFVLNNPAITLTISTLLSNIAPKMSFFLRITRITVPYGSGNLVLCHPYPIWLNDQNGRVYNGSLFLPIIGQRIEIEKLILQRSLQKTLGKIKGFPIFTPNQLDFNQFHPINTKVKSVIGEFQLRHSVLHFQVVCIDENNYAYPTDMRCQTEPIYEYEGSELKNLPPYVRQIQKASTKRKGIGQLNKSSMKTKMSKKKEKYG